MTQSTLAVQYADIAAAAQRLAGVAHPTPVLTSRQADERSGAQLYFKCENFQRVGAFKFRGAYNAISCLDEQQRRRGVVAFSSGNHAQGMALAARMLGVPVTIVMPTDAPAMKLAATREYGAEIILYDRKTEDREVIAARLGQERGLAVIPAYDHAHVSAGQGTAAKELFDSVAELDYLFVSTGGGGLLSGSALAAATLSPRCAVIGVEPETGNDAQRSLRRGQIVHIEVPDTIADGAQTQHSGKLVLHILQAHVRDIVTGSDDRLRSRMRFFAERMKMVVEGAGALAAAAAMNGVLDIRGKKVGVIVSGGNIDMALFAECMARSAPQH